MIVLRDRLCVNAEEEDVLEVMRHLDHPLNCSYFNTTTFLEIDDYDEPIDIDIAAEALYKKGLNVDGYIIYDCDGWLYRTEYEKGRPITHALEWVLDIPAKDLDDMKTQYEHKGEF